MACPTQVGDLAFPLLLRVFAASRETKRGCARKAAKPRRSRAGRVRLAGRPEGWRWSSARAHLGLAPDPLTDLAPTRERIDDWRAFLEQGLDPDDHAALRAAERSGRIR
jgi:hypothetical protein